jgi:hypothetical protein
VLNKYKVSYFLCENCGLVQTEEPYWLEEAYSSAISNTDTGILSRNLDLMKKLTVTLLYLFGKNAKKYSYLDYGGGYGILVRLMRDIGFDFYWDDKYAQNLFAKGFEYTRKESINAVTAFEVFEHLADPKELIGQAFRRVKCDTIIFSTLLYGEKPPPPEDWWYYSFESGQHISFYNIKTLKYLANYFNCNLLSDGLGFHILTKKKKLNPIFKLLIKFNKYLFPFLKRQLKSKTFSDHNYIKKLY